MGAYDADDAAHHLDDAVFVVQTHTEGRNGDACVFQARASNGFVLQVQFFRVVSLCGTCETQKRRKQKRRNAETQK